MSSKVRQIDETYIKYIYREITEHIENYQKDFNKDSEAFDSWAKTICNPKYKLIKNLLYLLEQNDTSFQDKQIIFSIVLLSLVAIVITHLSFKKLNKEKSLKNLQEIETVPYDTPNKLNTL